MLLPSGNQAVCLAIHLHDLLFNSFVTVPLSILLVVVESGESLTVPNPAQSHVNEARGKPPTTTQVILKEASLYRVGEDGLVVREGFCEGGSRKDYIIKEIVYILPHINTDV